jgi:hypothetical protein
MKMENYNTALKEANKEWDGVLIKLWTAFGKQLDLAQFKVYRDELGDVPLGVLEHVISVAIKRHKFNSVPTLSEVNEVLRELHPDYRDELYVHSTPHRVEAERKREQGVNYPKAVDQYREWVTGKVTK